jgi:mRNA (guanine-N7-)-methyltransferase
MDDIIEHYKQPLKRCDELEPVHIYNNFIKASTIHCFIRNNAYVFDMACGRGGDILKYAKHSVAFYLGIDICPERIEEAKNRFKSMRHCMYPAVFEVGDFAGVLSLQSTYDFVSCQFAFHYAWSTRDRALQVMRNARNIMNPDACFCLTFPDYEVIKNKLERLEHFTDFHNFVIRDVEENFKYRVGGHHYYLEFTSRYPLAEFIRQLETQPYNQKYVYFQRGAVHAVEEFLVHPGEFQSLCEECGFSTYLDCNFMEFESAMVPHHNLTALKAQMRVKDFINVECQDIVNLYRNVVLFQSRKRRKLENIKMHEAQP